jgi:hypothetical protein
MPDFEAGPCLWRLADGCLLGEREWVSYDLEQQIEAWLETWHEHCYYLGDNWDDRGIYEDWARLGDLLRAREPRTLTSRLGRRAGLPRVP